MPADSKNTALLQAVFDAAVDAIIVADHLGIITSANAAARQVFGYSTEEMLGQNVTMLMPESEAIRHDGYLARYVETHERRVIGSGRQVQGKRADGSVFPLYLSIGELEVEGKPTFVAILHDLTKRIEAQEALARAQRMEAFGQLTGGLSHDFNNLLTVIVGNLELLEMRLESNAHQELIADALEAAEVGAEVTSRLLAFARRAVLTPESIDINKALNLKAPKDLTGSLGPRHKLVSKLQLEVWKIAVDVTQLQTAVLNLVENARDAMPDGGTVNIKTRNVVIDAAQAAQDVDLKPGRYVALSVTDAGHGMPNEVQRQVFDPFFTTKPRGKGVGLGMSMVYGFVKQSGGHITINSESGRGSTVTLYFPALPEKADDIEAIPGPSPRIGHGELVMVVEDDDRVRRLSCERIQNLGFRVIEATSAQQAYDLLLTTPEVALIFTDIVMPGAMSGYDLAQRVRRDLPGMKILLTSGYAGELLQDARKRLELPLLRKPYRQSDLVAHLQVLFPTG